MNGLPYYKAYPRDFIEGTIGMSFELKCAYRVVLDLIYMQGGSLPDDARYISGLLGCSVRKWNSIREALVSAGKITPSGGSLRNYRADKELESLAKHQDKQREKAMLPRKNNDLQQPQPSQSEPEPEPDKKDNHHRQSVATSGASGDDDDSPDRTPREQILLAIGVDPSGLTGRGGTMLGQQGDMDTARRWASDLGLTLDEICAVIRDVMSRKQDGAPPSSFTYFTKSMREAAGRKSAPTLTAITGGRNGQQSDDQTERLRRIISAAAEGTSGGGWG